LVSRYHTTTVVDKHDVSVHNIFMKPVKAMTIRLTNEQADALETVASVEERSVSEVIRAAIEEHIDSRKKDPAFQDSLKDRLARARRLLRE
jgi:predicted transcriptional regulator